MDGGDAAHARLWTVAELEAAWSESLQRYGRLRAQLHFYAAAKEQATARDADEPAGEPAGEPVGEPATSAAEAAADLTLDLTAAGDTSRFALEQDAHLRQAQASLEADVSEERAKGAALRAALAQRLDGSAAAPGAPLGLAAHDARDLEALERQYVEIDALLTMHEGAASRLEQLRAKNERLKLREASIAQQIARAEHEAERARAIPAARSYTDSEDKDVRRLAHFLS